MKLKVYVKTQILYCKRSEIKKNLDLDDKLLNKNATNFATWEQDLYLLTPIINFHNSPTITLVKHDT